MKVLKIALNYRGTNAYQFWSADVEVDVAILFGDPDAASLCFFIRKTFTKKYSSTNKLISLISFQQT